MKKILLTLIASATLAFASQAQLLVYEGFNAPNGTTLPGFNGGVGWGGVWSTTGTNSYSITNNSFTYSTLSVTGNKLRKNDNQVLFRLLDTSPSGALADYLTNDGFVGRAGTTLWMSFIHNTSSTNGCAAFVGLFDRDTRPADNNFTNFRTGSYILFGNRDITGSNPPNLNNYSIFFSRNTPIANTTNFVPMDGVYAGTNDGNAQSYAVSNVPVNLTTSSLFVVKIDFVATVTGNVSATGVSLYINPDLNSIPSIPNAYVVLTTNGTGFVPKFRSFNGRFSCLSNDAIDEIRFGKTFADVTPNTSNSYFVDGNRVFRNSSVDLGSVPVGTPGMFKDVVLNNNSSSTLTVSSVALSGADAADFELSAVPSTPADVTVAGMFDFDVRFKPLSTVPGLKTSLLTITSTDASTSPFAITLTGRILAPQSITITGTSSALTPSNTSVSVPALTTLTLMGMAESGNAVSVVLTNAQSLGGGMFVLTNSGMVSVNATVAGNASFTPAVANYTINVTKLSQTVGYTPPSNIATGQTVTFMGVSSAGLPLSFSVVSSTGVSGSLPALTFGSSASALINVSAAGNNVYNDAPSAQYQLRTKADQTITISGIPSSINALQSFTYAVGASSALAVSVSISGTAAYAQSGNTVSLTGSGVLTITATQVGDNDFNPAMPVVRVVTVNKLNNVITFSLPTSTGVNTVLTLSGTASSGLSVTYSTAGAFHTSTGNRITVTGAGVLTVTATQVGNTVYEAAASVVVLVNVLRTPQTITFNLSSNTAPVTLTLSGFSTSGLPVSYSIAGTAGLNSGTVLALTTPGVVTITAFQNGNATFAPAVPVVRVIDVAKYLQTLDLSALPLFITAPGVITLAGVTDANLPVTYTLTQSAQIGTISGNLLTLDNVEGVITITATQVGNDLFDAYSVDAIVNIVKSTGTATLAEVGANYKIYPNPSEGLINVNVSTPSLLTVYSALGEKVYSSSVVGSASFSLNAGFYIVEISLGGKKYLEKIIVK